jgi:subtilisin family serine protease
MAGFSSQGPTQQDLLVKPDVVAPGADVLSSFPSAFCASPPCWAIIGGTSMATPHLAGAAAVVRGLHPAWDAAQVRSAIVNTADDTKLRDSESDKLTTDALKVGAGLLDLQQAVDAPAAIDPVSTSFGPVSSGSGRTIARDLVVTNLSTSSGNFAVTIADDGTDGVHFATAAGAFTLAPGASRTVTVTMTVAKGTIDGPRQATLVLRKGTAEAAHSVLFTFVGEGDRAPGPHLGNRNKD